MLEPSVQAWIGFRPRVLMCFGEFEMEGGASVGGDELVVLGCSRTGDVSLYHRTERLKVLCEETGSFSLCHGCCFLVNAFRTGSV